MDSQLLTKKADNIKRIMLNFTAYANDPSVAETLITILESAELEEILIQTCPDFNEWMESLSTEPVSGLGDECSDCSSWKSDKLLYLCTGALSGDRAVVKG